MATTRWTAQEAHLVAWYKYNGKQNRDGKAVYSYDNPQSFTPAVCSMWFMSGSTNVKFSHQVLPQNEGAPGLRVSVSFRQDRPTNANGRTQTVS